MGRSDVNAQRFDLLKCILGLIVFNAVVFVIAPLFVLSKLFQILFPYVIIAYLSSEYVQNGMQWWIEIDMFQLCMLFIYIGLQCVLLILGVCVCTLHWYLWHISPGQWSVDLSSTDQKQCVTRASEFYEQVQSYQIVEEMLCLHFGPDIGGVIFYYFLYIELDIKKKENQAASRVE